MLIVEAYSIFRMVSISRQKTRSIKSEKQTD